MESHKVLQDVTNTELPINMKGKSSWKDENLENLDEVLENQEMFKLSKSTDAIQDRPTKIRKKTGRIPPPLTIPQVHTDCVGAVTPEEDLNLPSYCVESSICITSQWLSKSVSGACSLSSILLTTSCRPASSRSSSSC